MRQFEQKKVEFRIRFVYIIPNLVMVNTSLSRFWVLCQKFRNLLSIYLHDVRTANGFPAISICRAFNFRKWWSVNSTKTFQLESFSDPGEPFNNLSFYRAKTQSLGSDLISALSLTWPFWNEWIVIISPTPIWIHFAWEIPTSGVSIYHITMLAIRGSVLAAA